MAFNLFELISKYNQFQNFMKSCRKNPSDLLNEELKRRNISPSQLEELKIKAQELGKLLNLK